jgi:beta-glucoside kinase
MSYVCFDIGGTSIKYVLINKDGTILSRGSSPTIHSSTEEFIDFLVKKVRYYEERTRIKGIGISVPGTVEKETGKSILGGAILHLYDKNLRELLAEHFSCPIHVENDARCALMAELTMGAAKENQDVVLMTIGTGIGGAVAYDRKIVYGNHYTAGEFGMMRLDALNHPTKTMHELASTVALIKRYKEKKFLFPSALVDPQSIFSEMHRDEETRQIVDEWATYLSAGIFNIAAGFNPEKIVIGGGISANPSLLPLIREKLEENPHWKDYRADIEIARFKNDAGAIGALSFLLQTNQQTSVKGENYVS